LASGRERRRKEGGGGWKTGSGGTAWACLSSLVAYDNLLQMKREQVPVLRAFYGDHYLIIGFEVVFCC
jgi:hypothetical protein